jgi:predicted enzyme related to lactoylglutathione lyase
MKPKFHGLRTVIYKVIDLRKATEWYSKAFDTQPYFDEPYYVGFEIGGYELGLHPWETDKLVTGDNISIYWGVDNVQAEYDRLIGLGATAFEAPENVGGEIIVAAVKDPWQNVIGLIYNPHFKAK